MALRSAVRANRDCPDCRVPSEFVDDGLPAPTIIGCTTKVGFSVGHKAGSGCVLAKYGTGYICDGCYARAKDRKGPDGKGLMATRYAGSTAQRAYDIRLKFAIVSMMTDAGRDRWVERVAHTIRHNVNMGYPFLRAFDAGDFLNFRHVQAWTMVAQRVAPISIWCPTRTWRGFLNEETGVMRTNLWLKAFEEFVKQPNVSCRPSALKYDELPPDLTALGFAQGTMVVTSADIARQAGAYLCPASTQDGRCDGRPVGGFLCTACHTRPDLMIAYPGHSGVKYEHQGVA